jgi:hypothetical protein
MVLFHRILILNSFNIVVIIIAIYFLSLDEMELIVSLSSHNVCDVTKCLLMKKIVMFAYFCCYNTVSRFFNISYFLCHGNKIIFNSTEPF